MVTTDIMIDLETLSTDPDCVVISLGAIMFNPFTGELGPTFYANLEIQDQLNAGRKIMADTMKWWFNQSDGAKKVFSETASPPAFALMKFYEWLQQIPKRERKVWGNGSTFDISIMEDMFKTYGMERPWTYNSVMDLRTFKRFVAKGVDVQKIGVAHNALDDAISQAKYVIDILRPNVDSNSPS